MENQKKVVNFEREMKKAQIKAWFRSKANSAANWLNDTQMIRVHGNVERRVHICKA